MSYWTSFKEYGTTLFAASWWVVMTLVVGIIGGALWLIQQLLPTTWDAYPFLARWPSWVAPTIFVTAVCVANFVAFHKLRIGRDDLIRIAHDDLNKITKRDVFTAFEMQNSHGNTFVNSGMLTTEPAKNVSPAVDSAGRELLRASELFANSNSVSNRRFRNCRIVGPAVIVLQGCDMRRCIYPDVDPQSYTWAIPASYVIGTRMFSDCVFDNCAFENISFAVWPDQLEQTRETIRRELGLSSK